MKTIKEYINDRDNILRMDKYFDLDDFKFCQKEFVHFNRADIKEDGSWLENHEDWTNNKIIIVAYNFEKVDIFTQNG